jgi:tetratricopeptide (TPR) repeat protein
MIATRRGTAHVAGIVVVALLAAAWPGNVHATDDKEAARRSYTEGSRLYDIADYAAALKAFKRAYLQYEEPAFLYNIGQCHRQLGQKREAVVFLRRYLQKLPNARNADDVRRMVTTLEEALAREEAAPASPPSSAPATPAPSASPTAPDAPAAATVPAAALTAAPPPRTPLHRRWWVWTAAGVAVAAVAVGLGVGLTVGRPQEPSFTTSVP